MNSKWNTVNAWSCLRSRQASPQYARSGQGNETGMGTYSSNPLMNDQPNMTRTSAHYSNPQINDQLERDIIGVSALNSDPRLSDPMDRGGNYPYHLDYSFQSNGSRSSFERQPIGHSLHDHVDILSQLHEMSPSRYYSNGSCSDTSSLRSFDIRRNDRYWSNASHGSGGMMENSASPQGSAANSWSKSSMVISFVASCTSLSFCPSLSLTHAII